MNPGATHCDTLYTAHEALAPGSQGSWNEVYERLRPWGFELAEISIPVLLMHGRQDGFLPVGHGEWLAAHIPGVDARFLRVCGDMAAVKDRQFMII